MLGWSTINSIFGLSYGWCFNVLLIPLKIKTKSITIELSKKKNARVSETFCQTHGVHVLKGNEKKNAGVSESTQKIQN